MGKPRSLTTKYILGCLKRYPKPGVTAREVFRGALFGTIPVVCAFLLGSFVGLQLQVVAGLFFAPLILVLFLFSCAFVVCEWRLSVIGIATLIFLLVLAGELPLLIFRL